MKIKYEVKKVDGAVEIIGRSIFNDLEYIVAIRDYANTPIAQLKQQIQKKMKTTP